MALNETARRYQMVARADGVANTRERIIDAAVHAFWDQPGRPVPLDEIAAAAGVSVQTLIRHFGGREGLSAAAAQREGERVAATRDTSVAGDPEAAVRQLVTHYEELGDGVLRLLAAESAQPGLGEVAESGRRFHRTWCRTVFADALDGLDRTTRKRRLAQIACVCDVYTWKLLRRDAGLSRSQTELALLEMLHPLIEES
jgi:AcrR family transcriptional regulator